MANPQKENGHLEIANEIWEALMGAGLNKNEYRALLCILRYSYGCGKKYANLTKTDIAAVTRIPLPKVNETLSSLEKKNIIRTSANNGYIYFHKDYEKWQLNETLTFDEKWKLHVQKNLKKNLRMHTSNEDFVKDLTKREVISGRGVPQKEDLKSIPKNEVNETLSSQEKQVNETLSTTKPKPLPDANSKPRKNNINTINTCNNTDTSSKYLTKCGIPDVEFRNLTPEQQKKSLDLIVINHFRKFPYKNSPLRKIYGKNGWVRFRIRVREYFEGIFEKYPGLKPREIIEAIQKAKQEEPWKYYPIERAKKALENPLRVIADKKPDQEDLEVLREARRALEVCSDEEKILFWLRMLPRALHGNLAAHLSRVYPAGHSYQEAKIRYEEELRCQ